MSRPQGYSEPGRIRSIEKSIEPATFEACSTVPQPTTLLGWLQSTKLIQAVSFCSIGTTLKMVRPLTIEFHQLSKKILFRNTKRITGGGRRTRRWNIKHKYCRVSCNGQIVGDELRKNFRSAHLTALPSTPTEWAHEHTALKCTSGGEISLY
jgi:hypothetical protein